MAVASSRGWLESLACKTPPAPSPRTGPQREGSALGAQLAQEGLWGFQAKGFREAVKLWLRKVESNCQEWLDVTNNKGLETGN